jgi:hypothetical protein
MQLSLEQIRDMVAAALVVKFGTDSYECALYCIISTFPDYVVARGPNADLYQIAFSIDDAGNVQLGDPQLVQVAYVPVSQAAVFLASEASVSPEEDGWSWQVQIIEAGLAHGSVGDSGYIPHAFTPEVVAQFAAAANNARFGRRHPSPVEDDADPARIAGWFSGGTVVGNAAQSTLNLLKNETDLRQKLMAARDAKKLDLFGLSVYAFIAFKPALVNGEKVLLSEKLGKLVSIDLVTEAGAGGKFIQFAASRSVAAEISQLQKDSVVKTPDKTGSAEGVGQQKGAMMKDRILKILEALRKHDAGQATTLTTKLETLKEDKFADFLVEVTEAAINAAGNAGTAASTELVKEARAALDESKKIRSSNLVELKVTESKLPAPAMKLVRERLKDQIVDEAAIDAEITRVRQAFADFSQVGKIGGSRIETGLDSQDKVQIALDKMFGVKESGQALYAEKHGKEKLVDTGIRAFRSIKQSYIHVTGDTYLQFGIGGVGGFTKISEATSLTTDFPNLLLNSLTKKLLQDYAEVGMNGLDQVFNPVDIADFKSQDRVRLGYLPDLATVTEDSGYVDFAKMTDEKISYAATKRGNTLPISRETILNDDLNKISVFPVRIARAGRRTLKQFVTNFFINNPAYDPDATAWFAVGHSNLGSAPLSIDELIAREIALFNQTEKDSGKPLGLTLDWLMVPGALKAIAYKINKAETYNPAPNVIEPNPFYQRFGANNERIIVNELLTDANDWYYGTLPSNGPVLEVGFVQGVREPQLFLQNDPTNGAVFTNDRITYKVRHEYGGDITDFRGVGKNVVP